VAKDIENILDNSFKKENLQTEADYFIKYQLTELSKERMGVVAETG
jgi:hypothetical protein